MARILVIDDEPSTQILLQSRLQDLGHEVVVAPTGAMGLMECRAQAFDLFLVDLNLGSGIDGYEVCRRLKARPQTHGVPVVLISGQMTTRDDLHRGYEAGCEAYLIKGDFSLLEDVVRAMLRLKRLQDEMSFQNQLLEQQNRKAQENYQRFKDLEQALRDGSTSGPVVRQLTTGLADGVLLVDGDGVVRSADRGARNLFGRSLDGVSLGKLAQGSGLEAFVRDAHTDPREGFRFTLPSRAGRDAVAVLASVMPLQGGRDEADPEFRVLCLHDTRTHQIAEEIITAGATGVPRVEIGPLTEAARLTFHPSQILGASPGIEELRTKVTLAAETVDPVLLCGPAGTGKRFAARVLHFAGPRSGAFVPVACGSGRVTESELLGHVMGAVPGATDDLPGLVHLAHNGSLLLEDVDGLDKELQKRVLELIEHGRVRRAGSREAESLDIRVVATSSADLKLAVDEGRFDADLYYKLSVVDVQFPALSERKGDIRVLASAFLRRFGLRRDLHEISEEAMWVIENYDWPGNVEELESCIERACKMASGESITVEDLPMSLRDFRLRLEQGAAGTLLPRGGPAIKAPIGDLMAAGASQGAPPSRPGLAGFPVDEPVSFESYEKACLIRAIHECDGDKIAAARLLKVGKSTLYRKLKRYGIK